MHGRGACVVGDMCGRGACVAGGVHGRGHVWQGKGFSFFGYFNKPVGMDFMNSWVETVKLLPRRGRCAWQGGMHGKGGMHGRGACMHGSGGACVAREHAWQGGMCGMGHAWQ